MAGRLVLDASSALIKLVVRDLLNIKWISALDRVGQHRVERQPIRA
jgi:hypothetical protein